MRRVCLLALLLGAAFPAQAAWPPLNTTLPPAGGGENDAAVIVGISTYWALPAIAGAQDNALDWNRYLQATRGVPMTSVTMLVNNDATKSKIENALIDAAAKVKPGGTLWFLYVGHGAPTADHTDGLILGVDTQAEEDSIIDRGLAQKRILEIMETGSETNAVAIFDACFSGTTGDGKTQLVKGSQATLPVTRIPDPATGRIAILSGSDQVAGPLPNHDRPAFSYLLLGSMRGWADKDKDKSVSLNEAYTYTYDVLTTFVKGRNQTPSLRGLKSMTLSKGAIEAGPDLLEMQEALGPVEDMFKSKGVTAPTIDPRLFASAGGLSQSMDINVERARDNAMDLAENKVASAEAKRDAWCTLAGFTTDKNHYREDAEKLCVSWKKFIEDEARVKANLGENYEFLADYLTLKRPDAQKKAAIVSFVDVFGKFSDRQEVIAAKIALADMEAGRPAVLPKDTDGDGLIIDSCPDEAEDMDGDHDDDGCPETTAAEAFGNTVSGIGKGASDAVDAVDEAGFHLYLFAFNSWRLDVGVQAGFGLWDESAIPTKPDQIAFRPLGALTSRFTLGPVETGFTLDWDLSRDLDDNGGYISGQAGLRVFGIGPWTPSVGVDYRNAFSLASGKPANLGVYFANDLSFFKGLGSRITYRYGLDAPGGIVPVHAVYLEVYLLAVGPGGSAVAELAEALFDLCD